MPTTSGRITPDDQIPPEAIDGVPPLFRSNLAKDGLAFPKDHPYYKNEVKTKRISSEEAKLSRNETRDFWNKKILKGQEIKIPTTAEYTNDLTVSRTSIKTLTAKPHDSFLEKNEAVKNLKELMDNSKYIGWAEDEIINGLQKHPFVNHWQYYEVSINKKPSFICIQVTNKSEFKPYSIENINSLEKIKGLKIKQKPPKVG
jgi:hypothetical protein